MLRPILALLRGPNGHPLHPPFTDGTIGAYAVASILGILAVAGVSTARTTTGWWLALLVALCVTVPTAVTGLADWLQITWWTPLWRVATSHLLAMVAASGLFLAALLVGHGDYAAGKLGGGPLALTLVAFALLTLGGWLGGTVVFVYGMRVLGLGEAPALEAVKPVEPDESRKAA
jgi:uncharacterized membrane protein